MDTYLFNLMYFLFNIFNIEKNNKKIPILYGIDGKKIKWFIIIYLIIETINYGPLRYILSGEKYYTRNMLYMEFLYFLVVTLGIFGYGLFGFVRKNLHLNETIILQQETYIKPLESMQEDIRKYNHDYKNLLTGVLLQAEEGDYDGVRLYLKDVFDEFEEKLGKQISKNTQLKKIKSNEVKGLLLSKMSKMEEFKIEFHLEVLNEVDRINMKTTDLVRCLGILLDNAIEEVEKLEEKVIKLVILQEEKVTTIMVKNPVTEKVNIQNIYEEGFSTKGEKRGLGLSNYKEIVENYENIVRETISTEREFNQILKIA